MNFNYRYNDPSFQPNKQYVAPAPAPAYNNQYQSAPAYQPAPAYQQAPAPKAGPSFQQQPYFPPQQQYTTEQPHRFQPPGKLSLNRTPDGFSYQFNKA